MPLSNILVFLTMLLRLAFMVILLGMCNIPAQSRDDLVDKLEQRTLFIDPLLNSNLSDSLPRNHSYVLDSLRSSSNSLLNKLKLSYDSIQLIASSQTAQINQHTDSLKTLNLLTNKLIQKADSIQGWRDKRLSEISTKVEKLKADIQQQISSLQPPPQLEEKASDLTAVVNKLDVSLPDGDLPLSFQDKLDLDVPSLSNPVNSMGLPDPPAANMPLVNVPNIGNELPRPQGEIPQVPASPDGIGKVVEEQVLQMSDVEDLQKELGQVGEFTEGAKSLSDGEALKQQLVNQAQEHAVDHFAGQETELQKAIETISKYKKKYGSFQNLEEIATRHRNVMHGKPLIERLVPGITLQIFRKNDWMVDFNPYVGYIFNSRLTAGLGWNERIGFDPDNRQFNSGLRIYGPRAYSEFRIWNGFSTHLQVECMNTFVPPQFSSGRKDIEGREWVFTSMAGVKKQFAFIKEVKGTFFMLYNLHDPHHRSPYLDKLNMRVGFEFPMKKKKSVEKTSRDQQ